MKKIVGLVIAAVATTGITVTAISRSRGGSDQGEQQTALANKPAPKFASLSSKNGNNSKYSKKFGGIYGKFLVSSDSSGQEWWDQKYESVKAQLPSSQGFRSVTKGYGDSADSLNTVCDKAYQSHSIQGESDTETFSKTDIWNFCSDGRPQPKSISEYNQEHPSVPLKEEYKSEESEGQTFGNGHPTSLELASILYPGNQWFWELKGEEFLKDPDIMQEKGYFGTYYKNHKTETNKVKLVKDACASAYKQIEGHTDSAEIYKWCSFAGALYISE